MFFAQKVIFCPKKQYNKAMKRFFLCVATTNFLCLSMLFMSACNSQNVNYCDYVSEYRSEIYRAENEGYALIATFSDREYPYAPDGVCAHKESLVEIYLTAPDNTKNYKISFGLPNGEVCGGDMSFDSVYARFFYSQSLATLDSDTINFTVSDEKDSTADVKLEAKRAKEGNELPMSEIITKLAEQKADLFAALTKGNVFSGEITVRLVYNEKCYYYVGVTDANGETNCFLTDAYTGKILAERKSV